MTQLENISGYVYDFPRIFTAVWISYVLDIAGSKYFSCQTDLVEECWSHKVSGRSWHMPPILVLRRQSQVDPQEFDASEN